MDDFAADPKVLRDCGDMVGTESFIELVITVCISVLQSHSTISAHGGRVSKRVGDLYGKRHPGQGLHISCRIGKIRDGPIHPIRKDTHTYSFPPTGSGHRLTRSYYLRPWV